MDTASDEKKGTKDENNGEIQSESPKNVRDPRKPTHYELHHKKRGMKPRSRRNRKRPKSEVLSNNEALQISSRIVQVPRDSGEVPEGQSPLFLRLLDPYLYTFTSHAKARWVGRSLLDVYATEFGSYPESYYRAAIDQGRILVSDRKVTPSYCIQRSDVLCHVVHRHEPAVAVSSPEAPFISIVGETSTLLAVDKPATLPVHPCGGYHQNSLIPLLERSLAVANENNNNNQSGSFQKLYTIHRLDRLTSGLTVLAKTSHEAQVWGKAIQQRHLCEKIYLARVRGRFPQNCPNTIPRLKPQTISQANVNLMDGDHHKANKDNAVNQSGNTPIEACWPLYGEWIGSGNMATATLSKSHHSKADTLPSVEEARQRNAYGYWIGSKNAHEKHGMENGEEEEHEYSLSQMAFEEHSVDMILQRGIADESTPSTTTNIKKTETNYSPETDTDSYAVHWLHFACPVRIAEPKRGVCKSGRFEDLDNDLYAKTVKPAQTSFTVVEYNEESDSTVVLCRPSTGRTHQIRLHLQHLGHPIANDPNYGGELFFANDKGRRACENAQEQLTKTTTSNDGEKAGAGKEELEEEESKGGDESFSDNCSGKRRQEDDHTQLLVNSDTPATAQEVSEVETADPWDETKESLHEYIARTCIWCARCNDPVLEYLVRSPGIWLHALQYTIRSDQNKHGDNVSIRNGESISFRTDLPEWAMPNRKKRMVDEEA